MPHHPAGPRRTSARAAVLTTVAALALAAAAGAAPATGAAGATERHAVGQASGPHLTRLVYAVADCEGCEVQLTNARVPAGEDAPVVWRSKVRPVEDGRVVFTVPSRRTWGMSVTVEAPWEGATGYDTNVVQRYDGRAVGERVTVAEARVADAASSCWAGTRRDRVRTTLVVREVVVDGVEGAVPGTLAFTRTTQDWENPVRLAVEGVLGSQDADVCRT